MERVFQVPEEFRIGRVVSRLFSALLANPLTFLALATLLTIPSTMLRVYISINPTSAGMSGVLLRPGGLSYFLRYEALALGIYFLFGYTLQAALAEGTMLYLGGERPSFGQCLSGSVRNFVAVSIIGFLSYWGMVLGIALLVVPGIILLVMWSVVIPVRIVEQTGITQSFGRSRTLTRGFRGKILLLGLMYLVFAAAIGFAIRPLTGVSLLASEFGHLNIPYLIVSWAVRIVISVILGVGTASVYYELRLVQEGVGADQMAAVFD